MCECAALATPAFHQAASAAGSAAGSAAACTLPVLGHVCACISSSHSGARIEEFIYDKLDRKLPSKVTNAELLGQHMLDAAADLGPETPYGQWEGEGGGARRATQTLAGSCCSSGARP